jgi:hypothetical protein
VLVQSAGLSDSRSRAFLSLLQQSRPVYPTTSETPSSTRSVMPSDLMRTPTTLKWSANHLCERIAHPRFIPDQPLPERKLLQSSQAPMLVSLRTVTTSIHRRNVAPLLVSDVHPGPPLAQCSRQGRRAVPWRHRDLYKWLPPPRGCSFGGRHCTLISHAPFASPAPAR